MLYRFKLSLNFFFFYSRLFCYQGLCLLLTYPTRNLQSDRQKITDIDTSAHSIFFKILAMFGCVSFSSNSKFFEVFSQRFQNCFKSANNDVLQLSFSYSEKDFSVRNQHPDFLVFHLLFNFILCFAEELHPFSCRFHVSCSPNFGWALYLNFKLLQISVLFIYSLKGQIQLLSTVPSGSPLLHTHVFVDR